MEPKQGRQQQQTGEGRILLMDDEDLVRKIGTEFLQYLGYTVDTATAGEEVLALYRNGLASGKPYAAVIMDWIIPGGMGGEETLRELKKIDPHVRTIVSSGYSNGSNLANFKEWGFDDMIPKPYNLDELAETLHRVMRLGR